MQSKEYIIVFRLAKELKQTRDQIWSWVKDIKAGEDSSKSVDKMIAKLNEIDFVLKHYGFDNIKED